MRVSTTQKASQSERLRVAKCLNSPIKKNLRGRNEEPAQWLRAKDPSSVPNTHAGPLTPAFCNSSSSGIRGQTVCHSH